MTVKGKVCEEDSLRLSLLTIVLQVGITSDDSEVEGVKPSVVQALQDTVMFEGDDLLFDCIMMGEPEPEVIWYHDEIPLKASSDVMFKFEGDHCMLTMRSLTIGDTGRYKCVAVNAAGEASCECNLLVKPRDVAPKFTKLLQEQITTSAGSRIHLSCIVLGERKSRLFKERIIKVQIFRHARSASKMV